MTLPRLVFAIFAICFTALVSASSLEEDQFTATVCNRNPQEWCSTFITAIECNAVKHCIKTDWSKPSSSSPNDDACTICVQQIENIREGIGSNVTKEVIEEALDYICELTFVTRALYKQCASLINTYVDSNVNYLLDLLTSSVDPETICKVLDLCSLPPSASEVAADTAIYYNNIVLHFPASNLQIVNPISKSPEPKLLGSKRCTWGPSYWCGNLTTSKECGSTHHCVSKYWSKKQFDEDNDSVCQVCKDIANRAKDHLQSGKSETFEVPCELFPLEEARQECMRLAKESVSEMVEVLASEMNATAACSVAGLCNSPRYDNLLANAGATDLSSMDSCVNCTVAFTSLVRFMQSASPADVLGRMLAVCDELSSFSDMCRSLITTHFESMYDIMKNQLPPSAPCDLAGMCTRKYHVHSSSDDDLFRRQVDTMLAASNDDLPCDFCKQVVKHYADFLLANTTEDECHQMLLGMCDHVGKFKDECTEFVNGNFQLIYTFLTKELDPSKICTALGLCQRSKNFVSDANMDLIRGRVIPVLSSEVELRDLMPVLPQEVTSAKADVAGVECEFCQTVMKIVQSELKNPGDVEEVEKVLEKVCYLVPRADRAKCDDFIDKYFNTLITILVDEADPKVVCEILEICSSPPVSVGSGNAFCPICQYMLHYIQEALQDPKDEKQIENMVEKFCHIMPSAEKLKCDQFVSQYSALIIAIMSQQIDPSLVCPALKVCPSSAPPKERCSHCRMFLTDLISQLGYSNAYEPDRIEDRLSSVALAAGLEKSVTALELRMSHREELVDMMTAEFDADESCVYMKFCDFETLSSLAPPLVVGGGDVETNEIGESTSPAVVKPSCAMCELFVKMYEKELTSNKTVQELDDVLDRLCDQIKNPEVSGNCTILVAKYVPLFLDLLKSNVSPRELCAAARLCPMHSLMRDADVECRTCEVAVGSLESVLGDPMVKESVFDRAIEICDHMSEKSRMICADVISELLPVVEGVVFDIPAWYVCTKLKLCPYGAAVDESACSNPELWCQDTKTAFLCDRLKYCNTTAWSSSIP